MMRFQCAMPGVCNTHTGNPYTVAAVDLEEGSRRMREHWHVDHDFEGEPKMVDVVVRMEPTTW